MSTSSGESDTERGLMKMMSSAHAAFRLAHFQECITTLDSHQFGKASSQQQIAHNRAVASFGSNKDTDLLLQTLLQLIGHNHLDDMITSKDTDTDTNEFQNHCLLFNIASLYFQQKKELHKTIQILLFLQNKLQTLNDDLFTVKVCFLLLEVLLLLRVVASKSNDSDLKVVEIEKEQQIRQIPIDHLMNAVVKDVVVLTASFSSSSFSSDATHSTLSMLMKQLATFLLYLYKCRMCVVTDTPKQAKKEIKNALEIFQREIRKHPEENVMHAYMCLHNLLPLSLSPSACNVIAFSDSANHQQISIMDRLNQMALYLKAYLEFQREHYTKAMKLLTSCQHVAPSPPPSLLSLTSAPSTPLSPPPPPPPPPPILQNNSFAYLNNMGCLYLKLERYGAAVSFFQKAIAQLEVVNAAPSSSDPTHQHTDREEMLISLLHPNHIAIYYNCGVALLYSNRPVEAMVCFENVLENRQEDDQSCPISLPLAHIRLGESCLQHHKQRSSSEESVTDGTETTSPPVLGYLSDGPFRRVVLSNTKPFSQPTNPCSLRKAVQCFTEALAYLAQEQRFVSPSTTSSEQTPVSSTSGSTLTTEREEEKNENQMNDIAAVSVSEMQEYATLALAFVHLKLSNWVCVQSTLRRLLKNPMTNEYGRYLAQNYLAEALCSLGKYEEAYEILDVQLTLPSPETMHPNTDQRPSSLINSNWGEANIAETHHIRPELMAEVVRNTNRAVVWALLGKLTDAQIILQSILAECPTFPPAIRGLVYTFLRLGKKQEASALLQELNVSPVSLL